MNEVTALLKKAHNALEDAAYLMEDSRYDAAANRIYYSVFYALQSLLVVKNEVPKTHKGLLTKFSEIYIKTGLFANQVYQDAQFLFNLRQESDYDLEDITGDIMEEAYQKAVTILELTSNYLSDENHNF